MDLWLDVGVQSLACVCADHWPSCLSYGGGRGRVSDSVAQLWESEACASAVLGVVWVCADS